MRIMAEVDTAYGKFPADLHFTAYLDGRMEGSYSFIGYEGCMEGTLDDSGSFSVSGTHDSYAGKIEFSVSGKLAGSVLSGEGLTAAGGRFTVTGEADGSF